MSEQILHTHFLRLRRFILLYMKYKMHVVNVIAKIINVIERTRDASCSVKTYCCGSWYRPWCFGSWHLNQDFLCFRRQQLLEDKPLLKDPTYLHLQESWTMRSNLPWFFPCLVGICLFMRVYQEKEWHKRCCSLVAVLMLLWFRISCWWHISAGALPEYRSSGLHIN